MKKIIILLILGFVLPCVNAVAQTTYTGKIVDAQQNEIIGASITATSENNKGTAADFEGNFSITLNTNIVKVSMMGYQTKTVPLRTSFNTIVLQASVENLEEVIVSASREIQQRSEVPAAIGIVSANQIQETKPIGIEQIVNQVPGVFMSTSRAASNEQHFTAIRSPISIKSLFLFLEDGLPIRPVAVFNHNALLEMNSIAFGRVEVLKGPASSIYGSEAIGGSINFITKNPTKQLSGSLANETNTLGIRRYEAEVSTTFKNKYGFYVGAHYVTRKNGPVGYSDYEKFALSLKNVNNFSETVTWTNMFDFIDYRSDMSGSITEDIYEQGDYQSQHTFTERDAKSFRFRSTLDKQWNEDNKTSFNFIFRDNTMDQIPSYRINLWNPQGEINSNTFKSYVGLVQHKINFDAENASLIMGATVDFSPQEFVAETIDRVYDTTINKYTSYSVNEGDYILNYQANLLNYAFYTQFEISPFEALKVTGALRYDGFSYDYDNLAEDTVGVADTVVRYENFSPKLGLNYNFSKTAGAYANYSKGFTPPQTSTLFRDTDNETGTTFNLKPAKFDNYEVGGYYTIPSKLKVDLAIYQLNGKDRLITTYDDNGDYLQVNAGKTRSRGVELGVKYNFLENLWVSYSGSYASHRYIEFLEEDVDYSDTDIQTAPNYIAMASLNYKPLKNLLVTLEHEQVGAYSTSFEGGAVVGEDDNGESILGTTMYNGHNVFNLRANFSIGKFEIWGQGLNIFNTLYSLRTSYAYGSNRYTVGNPRAFHLGVKYNF